MSKEAEVETVSRAKEDVEYSEVIELTTLSKDQLQEIFTPPPQFSETQFDTYITMDEGMVQRPTSRSHFVEEPHSSRPTTSRPHLVDTTSQDSTFRRYSTVENSEVIEYENAMHNRLPPGEDIVTRFRSNVGHDAHLSDDIMSLRTRLKARKRRMIFIEYACYAIEEVYQEVEKILILDIVFLIFSVGVSALGMKRVAACTYLPTIPVAIVISGVVDAFVNTLSTYAALTNRPKLKEALLDIIRMGRLTLFFIHIYGLAKVYSILPPEESDSTSPEYCESLLYWMTFAYFHITFLSSVVVIVGMAAAVACYYV